jgi:phosphoribosylaminoimidazole carboxylase / phosphoribosylaminoimidazole-succinocarboxamide synthase
VKTEGKKGMPQVSPTDHYILGSELTSGKTKTVHGVADHPDLAVLESMDDITAGDGEKHDVIAGKGAAANQTTCNVFRLLNACGVLVAFVKQLSATTFLARLCDMLPYEVVVRREAHGSYLKRMPHLQKGHLFPQLIVEFYLKTADRIWGEHSLICDDPFMVVDQDEGVVHLYDPAVPIRAQEPFLTLPAEEVFQGKHDWDLFPNMARIARQTFLILEKAWQLAGRRLVDFKVEFGLDTTGVLLLADVIDSDSWRVTKDETYQDKQVYREGGTVSEVLAIYQDVAEITANFLLPIQKLIIWRGSESDDVDVLLNGAGKYLPTDAVEGVTSSAHKTPVHAVTTIQQLAHDNPAAVVIAFVGMSNAAGAVLSATTNLPVITVPADVAEFPEDVWSCLRAPSNVPVLTAVNPKNALLAAMQILSLTNPKIYAELRLTTEERQVNFVRI